jgi:DNA polymerase-3 subunit alpha
MKRYELPIWPEMYEEKLPLLRENQVLAAVISVDKREGTRLSCHWIADIASMSAALVEECDKAYDKAKMPKFRPKEGFSKAGKGESEGQKEKASAPAPKPEKEKAMLLKIVLDLTSARLSHILQIKQLLSQHEGASKVEISFQAPGRKGWVLYLDRTVSLQPALIEALKKIPSASKVESVSA